MERPVIGIPASILTTHTDIFHGLQVTYTTQGFIDGLLRAGAVPLLLPIADEETAICYLDQVDGILLAGGQDVSPQFYHEEPHQKLGETSPSRDRYEMAIVKEAWSQQKPILAVCRGMQLLNVLFGGTLYQDLSDFPSPIQHLQASSPDVGSHTVDFTSGSWLSGVYGEKYRVNSYHHQGIKRLSESFRAVAWSRDGLVEGIEAMDSKRKAIGLQWHPEMMIEKDPIMQSTFDAFVQLVGNEKQANKIR